LFVKFIFIEIDLVWNTFHDILIASGPFDITGNTYGMKLKPWQIALLIVGGIVMVCTTCSVASMILRLFTPASPAPAAPTVDPSVQHALETIQATNRAVPSKTLRPTNTRRPTSTPTSEFASATPPALLPSDPAVACVPKNVPERAMVVHVTGGNTIEVVMHEQTFQVRYIGVDTPLDLSSQGPFGREAYAQNTNLTGGKPVLLVKDVTDRDKNGRLLRYVFANGIFVNYALVRYGFGEAKPVPPDVACAETFAQAQETAKSENAGRWALVPRPTVTPTPTISPTVTETLPPTLVPTSTKEPKEKNP
jgi:micrococcal nuclease